MIISTEESLFGLAGRIFDRNQAENKGVKLGDVGGRAVWCVNLDSSLGSGS